jgi:hypothetical protein
MNTYFVWSTDIAEEYDETGVMISPLVRTIKADKGIDAAQIAANLDHTRGTIEFTRTLKGGIIQFNNTAADEQGTLTAILSYKAQPKR